MGFDPNKPFKSTTAPTGGFDPNKPFKASAPEKTLMEKLAGPIPKLPGNPYGVNDAVEQVSTPQGLNELAAMELVGQAGGAVLKTAGKVGGGIINSPIGKAVMHKTGLDKVAKVVPELWDNIRKPFRPGLEVKGPNIEVEAASPAITRPVNPEVTEALAIPSRPTPPLEAPSPGISRPVNNELAEALKPAPKVELEAMRPNTPTAPNPELTEALRPAPSIELGPIPPTAPRSGSNGPSLQDILRYAEQQGTPATGQPAALESTLANAIKPKWNGPKIQRRGVE